MKIVKNRQDALHKLTHLDADQASDWYQNLSDPKWYYLYNHNFTFHDLNSRIREAYATN